jgi:hypothetical protein
VQKNTNLTTKKEIWAKKEIETVGGAGKMNSPTGGNLSRILDPSREKRNI